MTATTATTTATTATINKLRDQARIPDSAYPLKAWFNTLTELVRSAQLTQHHDHQQGFVLWLRAAGVADILSKHPELRTRRDGLSTTITQYLSVNVPTIIESAGTLEAILKSQLDSAPSTSSRESEEQLALDAVADYQRREAESSSSNQGLSKLSSASPLPSLPSLPSTAPSSNSYHDNWEVIPPAIPNAIPSTSTTPSAPHIDPYKLYKYLSSTTFGDTSILLLDCRPLEQYKRRRITLHPPGGKGRAGVVWIDPHSLTSDLTPAILERIIKSSSSRGYSVYTKRHLFDYIVVFDEKSQAGNLPASLRHLLDNLHNLQNPALVLNGGFQSYDRNIGADGVEETGSVYSSNSGSAQAQKTPAHTPHVEMPQPDLLGTAGRSASAAPDIGKENGVMPSPSYSSYTSLQPNDYISYQPHSQPSLQHQPLRTNRSQLPTPPLPSRPPHSRRRSEQVDTEPYAGYRPRLSIDYPSVGGSGGVMNGSAAVAPKMPAPTAQPLSPSLSGSQYSMAYNYNHYPSSTTTAAVAKSQSQGRPPPPYKATYWYGEVLGLTGLKNLGNTCYMNSTLQCLSATIPFARFFTSGVWKRCVNTSNRLGMQGRLAESFSQIISHMWKEQFTFISPMTFRKTICTFARQFSGTDQHDAQEFLSFLLDGLHEDLKMGASGSSMPVDQAHGDSNNDALETLPTPLGSEREWKRYKQLNDSVIVDYFQGQFRNRMECLSCHKTSTTYNSFMYLSLPVPSKKLKGSVSLTHCLDAFLKDEIMEKDNAWKCPNCKTARKSLKRLSIARLPPVLLIQLKRFSYSGPFSDKIETLVTFPLKNLNLTPYTPHNAPQQQFYGISNKEDPTLQHPPFNYELYGVTNHYGSLQSGHYTANVRSGNEWFNCADSRVGHLAEKDVVSKYGYMLYYKRVPLGK